MRKALIAVDGTKSFREMLSTLQCLVSPPEELLLLHVEQLEGNPLMIGMLGDAEMSTLKESLRGTEHKEKLDRKAAGILSFYKEGFERSGFAGVRTIIREGDPAEEILKAAREEGAELIVVGCSGKSWLRRHLSGCASREVENKASVPVLITKSGGGCGEHAHLWSGKGAYIAG